MLTFGACCGSEFVEGGSRSKHLHPRYVLLGRGRTNSRHPSNIVFGELVQANAKRYEISSPQMKEEIVAEILVTIYQNGGGFRRFDRQTTTYIPLDPEAARQKVMHAIQHVIRRSRGSKTKTAKRQKSSRNAVADASPKCSTVDHTCVTTDCEFLKRTTTTENSSGDEIEDEFPPFSEVSEEVGDPFELELSHEPLETMNLLDMQRVAAH